MTAHTFQAFTRLIRPSITLKVSVYACVLNALLCGYIVRYDGP